MRPVMLGEPLGEEGSEWIGKLKELVSKSSYERKSVCVLSMNRFTALVQRLHVLPTTLIPHYERLMTTSCESNPFSHQTSSPSNLIRSFSRRQTTFRPGRYKVVVSDVAKQQMTRSAFVKRSHRKQQHTFSVIDKIHQSVPKV